MKQGEIVPDEGFVIMIQVYADVLLDFMVHHVAILCILCNIYVRGAPPQIVIVIVTVVVIVVAEVGVIII